MSRRSPLLAPPARARRPIASGPSAKRVSVLFALLALSCSTPVNLYAPRADLDRARLELADRLRDPEQRARAHLDAAWLCLLHGRGCAQLREHVEAAVQAAPDMSLAQLTRALARQARGDIGARAAAWLDLLRWLDVAADPRAPRLRTLASEALARLAVRDRRAVLGAVAGAGLAALSGVRSARGSRLVRLRRALATLGVAHRGGPAPLDLHWRQLLEPISPRLYTGLRGLTTPPRPPGPPGSKHAGPGLSGRAGADPWNAPDPVVRPTPEEPDTLRLFADRPGTYLLSAKLDTALPRQGACTLYLRGPRVARVWLGAARLLDHRPPGPDAGFSSAPLPAAATGTELSIAVAVAASGEGLEVAVLCPEPPGRHRAGPVPRPWPAPIRTALHDLECVAGEPGALALRYPRGPLAAMLELERHGSLSDHAERTPATALDRILGALPRHVDARLERAARARDDGDADLARRLVAPLLHAGQEEEGPASRALLHRADLWLEIARQRLGAGLGDLATAAAARAVAAQPGDCEVLSQAADVGLDAMARPALIDLLRLSGRCRGRSLPLLDARIAVGQLRRAAAELAGAATLTQLHGEAGRRALAVAETLGDDSALVSASASERRWHRVQVALASGAPAGETRPRLDALLLDPGVRSMEQRRAYFLLGARPPWARHAVDGLALARRWQQECGSRPGSCGGGAPLTWLLDHEIGLLLPGGGALRRVHRVAAVHTARAAEALGELTVPGDAELVLARTITASGKLLLPAATPDKATVSLRGVGPGAIVEFVQVQFVAPDDPATGATRLPPFVMQSSDGPTGRATYVVMAHAEGPDGPAGAPPPAPADVSPSAPSPLYSRRGRWRSWTYSLTDLPRVRPEPRAARPEWSLPALRVRVRASRASMVARFEEVLAAHLHLRSPRLLRWVAKARAAGRDPRRWRALVAAVAATVTFRRLGTDPGSPLAAVRDGKGDRATLLWVLAVRSGLEACLARWQPQSRTPAYGAPDPRDYSASALRVVLRSPGGAPRPLWIDPGVDGGLLDYLRPGVRRRPALLLGCGLPPARAATTTPDLGAALDRREIRARLAWEADGSLSGTVSDSMAGSLAALVRGYLRAGGGHRQQLIDQLLGRAIPSARATWLGIDGTEDAEGRLTVRYHVELGAASRRVTRLSLGLFPARLGHIYARPARRRTALRFGHALDTTVRLLIDNRGGAWGKLPDAFSARGPRASLQRLVQRRGRTLQVTSHLRAAMGIVPASRYPAMARTLRAIDRAERLHLERAPTGPGP